MVKIYSAKLEWTTHRAVVTTPEKMRSMIEEILYKHPNVVVEVALYHVNGFLLKWKTTT